MILFPLFATGFIATGDNLLPVLLIPVANFHRCHLLPVLLIPVANLPPISTKPGKLVANFAADIVDTGGAP
jgi:hypothetical protein